MEDKKCDRPDKELKTDVYCDCKGNPFCITQEVYTPYYQKHELIPPIFESTTFGSETYYKGKITKDVYKNKGKTFLHIKRPFKVGDILVLSDFCNFKYFIRKKLRRKDFFNNFVFVIERLDGSQITHLDLKRLKKNKTLLVKGYLSEKNNNNNGVSCREK